MLFYLSQWKPPWKPCNVTGASFIKIIIIIITIIIIIIVIIIIIAIIIIIIIIIIINIIIIIIIIIIIKLKRVQCSTKTLPTKSRYHNGHEFNCPGLTQQGLLDGQVKPVGTHICEPRKKKSNSLPWKNPLTGKFVKKKIKFQYNWSKWKRILFKFPATHFPGYSKRKAFNNHFFHRYSFQRNTRQHDTD